ncbi:hypothetical protein DM02DRAFT_116067 [Periconia macrospinosa]|uniref:Uncharacterized protein n=1 Tax=Periconia macrospinosa TaxID=97972 RepID=A0A2V1DG28_9PLEO|nr:hypothetical protein DM02DRAFT_116067 [Periconia macrospinosa]
MFFVLLLRCHVTISHFIGVFFEPNFFAYIYHLPILICLVFSFVLISYFFLSYLVIFHLSLCSLSLEK